MYGVYTIHTIRGTPSIAVCVFVCSFPLQLWWRWSSHRNALICILYILWWSYIYLFAFNLLLTLCICVYSMHRDMNFDFRPKHKTHTLTLTHTNLLTILNRVWFIIFQDQGINVGSGGWMVASALDRWKWTRMSEWAYARCIREFNNKKVGSKIGENREKGCRVYARTSNIFYIVYMQWHFTDACMSLTV